MPSIMSSRLAAELDHAFERNGWSAEEVKQLSSGNLLADVRKVVLGQSKSKTVEHVIDCDYAPYVPYSAWKVEEHRKDGQLNFDASKIGLYLSVDQKKVGINGRSLRQELTGKPVLNAKVLDFLLENPHLIPKEWKGKHVCFWGTIYLDGNDGLQVRYLDWPGGRSGKWGWGYWAVDADFFFGYPAAVRIG